MKFDFRPERVGYYSTRQAMYACLHVYKTHTHTHIQRQWGLN